MIPRLKIAGLPIDYVFQYKYLGVTIDELLSFNAHLNNTIKLVSHKIFLLRRIKYYITEEAAIRIYKSMIMPYLDYGDILFMNSNAKLVKKTANFTKPGSKNMPCWAECTYRYVTPISSNIEIDT